MSQTNEVFIVTGCSRGVGAALFQMAGRAGRRLLGIARHVRDEGLAGVSVADPMRESWAIDLRDSARVVERLRAWLLQSDRAGAGRWVLINNAALLEPPGDLARQSVDQTSAVLRVGVEAPMLLTATLLSVRDEIGRLGVVPRVQIMNIYSGLGRRAMAGTLPTAPPRRVWIISVGRWPWKNPPTQTVPESCRSRRASLIRRCSSSCGAPRQRALLHRRISRACMSAAV